MSTSLDLVAALKRELKASGLTYAALAKHLGLAESSIKRSFARGEMPLSRIDAVLRVLKLDFAELARRVVEAEPERRELTLEQERAVVADPTLMLLAICCVSQWTFEQMVEAYAIEPTECLRHLARLDRLGVIELRPKNRYRLLIEKGFRWRPEGPVMDYFRRHVIADYFGGGFDGEGETLMLVHGSIGEPHAAAFVERLQRIGQDFARQHLADQRLGDADRRPYTLLVGMRSWVFTPFRKLRRAR